MAAKLSQVINTLAQSAYSTQSDKEVSAHRQHSTKNTSAPSGPRETTEPPISASSLKHSTTFLILTRTDSSATHYADPKGNQINGSILHSAPIAMASSGSKTSYALAQPQPQPQQWTCTSAVQEDSRQLVTLRSPYDIQVEKVFRVNAEPSKPKSFPCREIYAPTAGELLHCRGSFSSKQLLDQHQKALHRREPYICNGCSAAFADVANCKKHGHSCAGLNEAYTTKYKCKLCGKEGNRPDNLKRHLKLQHRVASTADRNLLVLTAADQKANNREAIDTFNAVVGQLPATRSQRSERPKAASSHHGESIPIETTASTQQRRADSQDTRAASSNSDAPTAGETSRSTMQSTPNLWDNLVFSPQLSGIGSNPELQEEDYLFQDRFAFDDGHQADSGANGSVFFEEAQPQLQEQGGAIWAPAPEFPTFNMANIYRLQGSWLTPEIPPDWDAAYAPIDPSTLNVGYLQNLAHPRIT